MNNYLKLIYKLGKMPPNECTPEYLAKQFTSLVKDDKRFKCTSIVPTEGLVYAVGGNGDINTKSYIVSIDYKGNKNSDDADCMFIGKGVTYDSGGYDIKYGGSMQGMKMDMLGAATLLALLKYIKEHNVKCNINVTVPICENLIGVKSIRADDVITTRIRGTRVEIADTDAEGRLILSDCIEMADDIKPRSIITIATLTGVSQFVTTKYRIPIFSNDDIGPTLYSISEKVKEKTWVLPIDDCLVDDLKSDVAKIKNYSSKANTSHHAAAYLKYFVPKKTQYAHFDIASTTDNLSLKNLSGTGLETLIGYCKSLIRGK